MLNYLPHAQEPLEEWITILIADREGIPPSEVTLEYIQQQREQRFYPIARYAIGTEYGGYNSHALEVLSRAQLSAIEREVKTALDAL
jgi:hypothetical protein